MDNLILVLLVLVVIFILLIILSKTLENKKKKVQEERQMNLVPVVPINQRTRGSIGAWKNVGILHSESDIDDTVFNLSARIIDRGRFKYEYRVTDKESGVTINLFDGDEVDELEDGDTLTIPGYESKGQFVAIINEPEELKYLPIF